MSTIRPRTPCTLRRKTQSYNEFGRPQISESRVKTRCAVIRARLGVEPTPVRTDSSASRGRGEQIEFDFHLLLHPRDQVATGDVIVFPFANEEMTVEIARVERRYDVDGALHHIEILGDRWE